MNKDRISASAIRRTLRLIAPDAAPHRALMGVGVIALLLDVVFRVMEPWPMKYVVDAVVDVLDGARSRSSAYGVVVQCAVLLTVVVVLRAVSNYLATVSFAVAGSRVAQALRMRIFHHVNGLSLSFHSRNRSADTVQRIVSDVNRLQEVAITAGMPLMANTVTLTVMVVVMFVLDHVLALVVLIAVLAFFVFSRGSSKKITAAARRTRRGEGDLANTAQESLSSIAVIQAYGLERFIEERFSGVNGRALRQGVKSLRLAARLERTTDVLVGLASATILVAGGMRVLDGRMTAGDLVLFTSYLRTCMKPLRDMAKYTGRISRAAASGERVAALMEVDWDITTPEDPIDPLRLGGSLDFERVVARYDGLDVLKSLTLHIDEGEHVAVIGPSGSGKSTLASLVVRSQDPVAGSVRMGGYVLTDLDLKRVRANVSMLHQEPVLFAATVRENILLGREDATDEEIEAAARAANAHDFIMEMPDGYDSPVGERGGTLSGGQRQRIAIARALLRDTPIVILDEATTGLDPEATTVVLDAIDRLAEGRTTLAITHSAKVAMISDRVVWIEDGRVLLDGDPQELLEQSELFRDWVAADSTSVDAPSAESESPVDEEKDE